MRETEIGKQAQATLFVYGCFNLIAMQKYTPLMCVQSSANE